MAAHPHPLRVVTIGVYGFALGTFLDALATSGVVRLLDIRHCVMGDVAWEHRA